MARRRFERRALRHAASGSAGLNSFVVRATDSASATVDATLEITIASPTALGPIPTSPRWMSLSPTTSSPP